MDPAPLKSVPNLYWFGAMALVAASLGIGFATGLLGPRKTMKTVASTEPGWQQLLAAQTGKRQFYGAMFVFYSSSLPIMLLSLKLGKLDELNAGGKAFEILAFALGILNLGWGFRALSASAAGDARVAVTQAPLRRDEELQLRIDIPFRIGPAPTEISARVICIEHAVVHQGRFVHVKHQIVRNMPLQIAATPQEKSHVSGVANVRLAAEKWPASGYGKSLNFRYELQLHVDVPGPRKHATVFPLTVL